MFLQRESLTPGCLGKWLRVEVGAAGNLAHGHFNHVSDPSEINSIFTASQKALKTGKKTELSLSCKQTPMSGCIYRLWGDGEEAIREFCLGSECEWHAIWLVTISGHHSEDKVIKYWLLKPLWPGNRKIYAGWSPNAQGWCSCRPGWGRSLCWWCSAPIYAERKLLKWQTLLRLV